MRTATAALRRGGDREPGKGGRSGERVIQGKRQVRVAVDRVERGRLQAARPDEPAEAGGTMPFDRAQLGLEAHRHEEKGIRTTVDGDVHAQILQQPNLQALSFDRGPSSTAET